MLAYLFTFVAALGSNPTNSSELVATGPDPLEVARSAQFVSSRLELSSANPLMVLVEGAPSAARLEARAHLEIYLREQGLLVLNHRALGRDRSHIDKEQLERCWSMGVEHLLLVSVEDSDDELRTRVRSLSRAHSDSISGAREARWSGVSVDTTQINIVSEGGIAVASAYVGMGPREQMIFELASPSRWQPRLGRGPDLRPVLRDSSRGVWIPYAQAYSAVGREDWQRQYDQRMRLRVGMLSTGSLVFAASLSSIFVFAMPNPVSDGLELRGYQHVALGTGLSVLVAGAGVLAASYLIDPHPVSIERFAAQANAKIVGTRAPAYKLRLQASPAGASAGFRAAF